MAVQVFIKVEKAMRTGGGQPEGLSTQSVDLVSPAGSGQPLMDWSWSFRGHRNHLGSAPHQMKHGLPSYGDY